MGSERAVDQCVSGEGPDQRTRPSFPRRVADRALDVFYITLIGYTLWRMCVR